MLYRELLDELKTSKGWTLDHKGRIRNVNGCCPVCYVANRKMKKRKYGLNVSDANDYLKLDNRVLTRLVVVVDNLVDDNDFSNRTRKDLLNACNLR